MVVYIICVLCIYSSNMYIYILIWISNLLSCNSSYDKYSYIDMGLIMPE